MPSREAPTSSIRHSSHRLLGVLAGAALMLAACGGDDDGDSTEATTATTSEVTDASDSTTEPSETTGATETTGASQPDATEPEATEPEATEPEATEPESTEAPAGGDVYDVCALATPADLEGLFGSPFEAGEATHHEQTGGDQCIWGNTDAPPVKVISVTVLRQDHLGGNFEQANIDVRELFEESKTYADNPQDLELGEQSYIHGSEIQVFADDTMYSISISGQSDEAIAGLHSFAELVLANAGV